MLMKQQPEKRLQHNLALDSSASITLAQGFNLALGGDIEIPVNGVFQSRSSNGKVDCILLIIAVLAQGINDARSKRVTTTYTVNDIGDLIVLGKIETCLPT